VTEKVGLHCEHCGATCNDTAAERGRFIKRHGVNCKKKKNLAFNRKLAGGTRSAGTSEQEDVDLYRLETIEATGRNLTDWENRFVASLRAMYTIAAQPRLGIYDARPKVQLTQKQKDSLERIYAEKTS
jgi:hypothetical protein